MNLRFYAFEWLKWIFQNFHWHRKSFSNGYIVLRWFWRTHGWWVGKSKKSTIYSRILKISCSSSKFLISVVICTWMVKKWVFPFINWKISSMDRGWFWIYTIFFGFHKLYNQYIGCFISSTFSYKPSTLHFINIQATWLLFRRKIYFGVEQYYSNSKTTCPYSSRLLKMNLHLDG